MVKFSIIVPVYQVQQYLERLVNSVLVQDYTEYELLLIDDGSSDNSGEICDSFSSKHTQIKTIHKQNGGVSSARNEGIKNAQGKYLIFLDADDFLDEGFLKDISRVLGNGLHDILVYGYCLDKDNSSIELLPKLKGAYTKEALENEFAIFANESSFNSVCNKIFRADIIRKNKFEFPEQKIAEDGIFVCQFLKSAKTFYFVDKAYYHYCQNDSSAVHKFCESRWTDENNYLLEMQKCAEVIAPEQTRKIMGTKYRNAILFDLYNLIESKESAVKCSKMLKNHLKQIYDLIDWNLYISDKMLKLQLLMLRRYRTLEIIVLMRLKKKINRLGK